MTNKLQEKMNVYLANQMLNFVKLHNLHWNVKGNAFFTLHAELENLYNQAATVVDDVAERLLALGGTPVSSAAEALKIATIKELPDGPKTAEATIRELTIDTEYWINDSKELVELAEEAGDGATADMFNDYLRQYQKLAWMLKAYNE